MGRYHAPRVRLNQVDSVSITTLIDNTFDMLLVDDDVARRPTFGPDIYARPLPIAEAGFAALVEIQAAGRTRHLLFDTGLSPEGLGHNLDALQLTLDGVEAVVLSHGHGDHTRGLPAVADRLSPSQSVAVVLHPDALLDHRIVGPDGCEYPEPAPGRDMLAQVGDQVIEATGPVSLLDGWAATTGEVARLTSFERGWPAHWACRNGHWEPDPWIRDDQSLVVHVQGHGLVVLTGCAHAGIVNTLRHAQAITGVHPVHAVLGGFHQRAGRDWRRPAAVHPVHAVLGGFHLGGSHFEPIIEPTVAALTELNPRYLMPCHCTGWRAIHRIAAALPEAFRVNSVGTTFRFEARPPTRD